MSRLFESREKALNEGFMLADRIDLQKDVLDDLIHQEGVALSTKVVLSLSGKPIPNQIVIEFDNAKGRVTLGSCKFRTGYDLWLMSEEICIRY